MEFMFADHQPVAGRPAPHGIKFPPKGGMHAGDPCPVPDCRKPVTNINGEPTIQVATVHGWVEIVQVAYTLDPCGHTFFVDVRPKPKPIKLPRVEVPSLMVCQHTVHAEITSMGDSHNHILCCECGVTWWSLEPLPQRPVRALYEEDYD
jgi:hypothetical protein